MAPNLLIALLSCVPSKRWFTPKSKAEAGSSSRSSSCSQTSTRAHAEPVDSPVPGVYRRVRGQVDTWLLVTTRDPSTGTRTKLAEPRKVVYCKLLHRWMFADDIASRTVWGKLPPALITTRTASGTSTTVKPQTSAEQRAVAYFQLDDRVTWVNHLDADGHFISSGGHARYCLVDREKGLMRPMLRGDDPVWCQSRRATPRNGLSRSGSSYRTSGGTTLKDDCASPIRRSTELADPKKLRSELQKLETVRAVDEGT